MNPTIAKACHILKEGGVVGMPTETVYGLAASINNQTGIHSIFSVKERPFFDPLIVHVADISMAKKLVTYWPAIAETLAENFWPGPLTLVLPKNHQISDLITSGFPHVGIRCPNHPMALELIRAMNEPLAAPSANKFTKTSPTCALHVREEFNNTVMVLDGGSCEVGIESTVIGIESNDIYIYRPGAITKSQIEKAIGNKHSNYKVSYAESPVAPGQMKHHYMPKAPIILIEKNKSVATQNIPQEILTNVIEWNVPHQANIAARELYGKFRELSEKNPSAILIKLNEEYKNEEEWIGILNRLKKAKTYDFYF